MSEPTSMSHPLIVRALDNPVVAVLASTTSGMVAFLAEAMGSVSPLISFLTALFACVTAGLIAAFWIRKTVIQLLHDIRAFRRGKLPPVEPGKPE